MITALLLLPVTAVLAWLYGRALPAGGRWSFFDSALLVTVASLAATASIAPVLLRWLNPKDPCYGRQKNDEA